MLHSRPPFPTVLFGTIVHAALSDDRDLMGRGSGSPGGGGLEWGDVALWGPGMGKAESYDGQRLWCMMPTFPRGWLITAFGDARLYMCSTALHERA